MVRCEEFDYDAFDREAKAKRDDAHRALGRYMIEFSQLIATMRKLVVQRLTHPDDPELLAELPLGEATASIISNAFFGSCELLTEHDEVEQNSRKRLRRDVSTAIEVRNDLSHGDWYVGRVSSNRVIRDTWLERIRPARGAGPQVSLPATAESLDAQSDSLERLHRLVNHYGQVCFGVHHLQAAHQEVRVRDVLVIEDGVLTDGPKARTN